MIRVFEQHDMDRVLEVWLSASIKAHAFVDASFWQSRMDSMRNVYIPSSVTYVIERQSRVVGFYSLLEHQLAALFVDPDFQGKGLGKKLLEHARSLRSPLTLTVYKENTPSCSFYLSQIFTVIKEQIDTETGRVEYLMTSPDSHSC